MYKESCVFGKNVQSLMEMFRLRFNEGLWTNVPNCIQISSSECNVTLIDAADEHGCMMLRVQAVRRGLMSEPVQACSKLGKDGLARPKKCRFRTVGVPGRDGEQLFVSILS